MNLLEINLDAVKLEECIYLYNKKNIITIVQDGKVVGFMEEED